MVHYIALYAYYIIRSLDFVRRLVFLTEHISGTAIVSVLGTGLGLVDERSSF
jgi:hypothetical protein